MVWVYNRNKYTEQLKSPLWAEPKGKDCVTYEACTYQCLVPRYLRIMKAIPACYYPPRRIIKKDKR